MERTPQSALVAGILFLVTATLALPRLLLQLRALGSEHMNLWTLVWLLLMLVTLAGEILLGMSLIQGKRDKQTLLGAALMAGSSLAGLLLGFFSKRYMQYTYSYSRISGPKESYEFSFWLLLPYLAEAAALVCLLLFAHYLLNTQDQAKQTQAKKLWFLPGALFAAQLPLGLLALLFAHTPVHLFLSGLVGFAGFATGCAALFSAMLWFAFPEGREDSRAYGDGYKGMIVHLLLSIVTLGIYQLIWICRVTKYLNARVDSEPTMTPWHQVVASMFLPFYMIYWVYKSAQRLDVAARAQGVQSNLTMLCTILQIFSLCGVIVPSILMQDKINALALLSNGAARPDAPCVQTGPTWGGGSASAAVSAAPAVQNPDQLPPL